MQHVVRPPEDHRHGPSRRTLLTGAAGLAGLGLLTLTGCSSGAGAGTPSMPEAGRHRHRAPRRPPAHRATGRVRRRDPRLGELALRVRVPRRALQPARQARRGRVTTVPDLAEEWSANADGTSWTFRLRQGVRFHDGRASRPPTRSPRSSTSSTRRPRSPQGGRARRDDRPRAACARSIRSTLRFDLTKPNAEFPSLLTAYQCYIVPGRRRSATHRPHRHRHGAVPAVVLRARRRRQRRGVRRPLRRPPCARRHRLLLDPGHHRPRERPARRPDRPDHRRRTSTSPPPGSSPRRAAPPSPGRTNAQWYTIPMLATSTEFSDPLVRQAMKLAYDPKVDRRDGPAGHRLARVGQPGAAHARRVRSTTGAATTRTRPGPAQAGRARGPGDRRSTRPATSRCSPRWRSRTATGRRRRAST